MDTVYLTSYLSLLLLVINLLIKSFLLLSRQTKSPLGRLQHRLLLINLVVALGTFIITMTNSLIDFLTF